MKQRGSRIIFKCGFTYCNGLHDQNFAPFHIQHLKFFRTVVFKYQMLQCKGSIYSIYHFKIAVGSR